MSMKSTVCGAQEEQIKFSGAEEFTYKVDMDINHKCKQIKDEPCT